MAQKRMFNKDIVCTRLFLEMPANSRALYYQLGVEADDDGFVDPYVTMLATHASEDELKILLVKGFVIRFESGVLVVTHWRQNNMIRLDRKKETIYKTELKMLSLGANEEYSLLQQPRNQLTTKCQPTDNQTSAQYSIDKDSIDKDSIEGEEIHTLTEKAFSSKKDITESVLEEISHDYEVPLPFARDCWDSAQNWLLANGKTKKNYKAYLINWIKKERANLILKTKNSARRGGTYDARE